LDAHPLTATPARPPVGLLLALLLAGCYFAYQPGTSGDFQFDDYSNLAPLERLDDVVTPDEYVQFVVKGIASPLGRPLSLLSFALQAPSWPDDAASFIRVNILLHLLNGLLLFWWLRRLGQLGGTPRDSGDWLALGATALWLLAPLQASTVLYVVQRMTELSATFVFLGMGLYLVGRQALARGARRSGLFWMSTGLAVGAGLGTLAKENAAQMPLMVLALEGTLLARLERPRAWRLWAAVFLFLPALALLGYLAWAGLTAAGFATRDFTVVERLLTEPRVLFMYLHKIVMPWPSAVRLFYDDFPASRGLFAPWTTLLALAALAGAIAAAWKWRAAAPLPAFAVFWFLACHVLESTTLSLELVFEHRNYQASVGLWLAIAAGARHLVLHASTRRAGRLFAALACAYLLLQVAVTREIATLWGRPLELSAWMAQRLPESRRAALTFAANLAHHQRPFEAVRLAERGTRRWPDDPSFDLLTASLACQIPEIPPPANLPQRLRAAPDNVNAVLNHLDNVLSLHEAGHCPVGLPYPLSELTGALLANPAMRKQLQNLLLTHSRALKLEGRGAESRETFGRAIDAKPQMILLIQGILDAVEAGDLALARRYLDRAHSDPRIRERDRWSHRNDLPLLEQLIRDREAAAAAPRPGGRFQ
jgi:protein O-mannosyl-transferase